MEYPHPAAEYIAKFNSVLEWDERLPYPDWCKLFPWLNGLNLTPEQESLFWDTVIPAWLNKLAAALSPKYTILESPRFYLLSAEEEEINQLLIKSAERSLTKLKKLLGELSISNYAGRHVILCMRNVDDYWHYRSHFHAEGTYAGSSGAFTTGTGYGHIILAPGKLFQLEPVLYHELIHNCLMQHHLPLWINEGFTRKLEIAGGMHSPLKLDRAKANKHWEFWDEEIIQEFWTGKSFKMPDAQKLSYELAEILFSLIETDCRPKTENLRFFIREASCEDAGDLAAQEFLGISVGELAAIFLGEGEWTPAFSATGNSNLLPESAT